MMLVLSAPFALADSFRWTGNGADDDFDTPGNWVCTGTCATGSYPDDTADDAAFPAFGAPHSVDLITESIDDVTIEGSTAYGSATAGSVTLTVDSFTISAGGSSVVVTFSSDATITG